MLQAYVSLLYQPWSDVLEHLARPEVQERFFKKFREAEEGCWDGAGKRKFKGYRSFDLLPGVRMTAHRASYIIANKHLDQHMMILHNCDNKPCVNPFHLRAGTAQDNARDEMERDDKEGREHFFPLHARARPIQDDPHYGLLTLPGQERRSLFK